MKKIFSPLDALELWDQYWEKLSFEENLSFCIGDQLTYIFHKYLDRHGLSIEAGCGLGKWVATLSDEGYPIIGLDTHIPSLLKAKRSRSHINLFGSSITNIPLEDNSLDAYISLGVMEHFEEGPQEPLREAYRVLKPGGIAIIETPMNNFLRRLVANYVVDLIQAIKKLSGKKYYFAEYRYSAEELKNYVYLAGFEIISVNPKDYEQEDKSIGLFMDIPIARKGNSDNFSLNRLGQYIKKILNHLSPWICSACVVCVGRKALLIPSSDGWSSHEYPGS